MRRSKLLCSALLLLIAAVVSVPAANAQVTVKFIAAGSSAMWQIMAIAAFNNVAGAGAKHYTIGGNCSSGPCGYIDDTQRSSQIGLEGGNVWIVWDSTVSNVWAYIAVDSVVGVRSFLATPRTLLQLDQDVLTTAGQNRISTGLWGSDESSLPSAVYNALSGATITAGATDIRPEDAYYASCRAMGTLDTSTYEGLGYGSGCNGATLVGTQIQSAFSSATANPVEFVLPGNADPFSQQTVPSVTTINVGAVPVLFLINKTNTSNLGAVDGSGNPIFNNIAHGDAKTIFSGAECDSNAFHAQNPPPNFAVHGMLREPLSGTMNTTEFTTFRLFDSSGNPPAATDTQENGVDPSTSSGNPLNQTCASGGGDRKRGIGTGEVVNGVGTTGGVKNTADSIGYAFFSYGNVSQLAGTLNYGYLKLDGVDGLNSSYTDGRLPTCTSPTFCGAQPNTSFPHLRDGTYRAWSVVRLITAPSDSDAAALVSAAQQHINDQVPDFVPWVGSGQETGLGYYRSHFTQSGIGGHNGFDGSPEAGGDMGGCIHVKPTSGDGITGERDDHCTTP